MKALYYLVLKPISFLPFFALYGLGRIIFFFVYRVFGYRKPVVMENLKKSFPNKSSDELAQISKNFYRHLSNLIVESIKIFSISGESAQKRMTLGETDEINAFYDNNQSVLMVGGHYSNWELFAVAIDQQIKHDTYAVYSPLKNEFMDRKMRESRGRYGLKLIPSKQVKRVLEAAKVNKKPIALILATDQSPSNPNNAFWMEFLNQDTGVLFGTEKYAKDYSLPVMYGVINQVKKGYYKFSLETLLSNPNEQAYGEITQKHTKRLEQDIIKQPEFWLWSHKRWKKKRPEHANQPR